ncbi:MAG TPA: ankyrin repeat domain-containing protein [Acidobacteriaceae bacterium]|nr:ankyrin repeat domain-containing protein [Acidobacteriaceae bacterium]
MSQQFLKLIQRGATAEIADAVAADPSLLTWRDAQGLSALTWSIYSGQTMVRDFLIAERLRAGIANDAWEAAACGDAQALSQALDAAPEALHESSPDGWTLLHLAAAFGSPQTVQLLLEKGANVRACSGNAQRNEPLHAALALSRDSETIRLLLDAGALPDARQTGGFTPIFSAAAANRRDLCELLLAHGANPRLANDFGQTAASYARERTHTELADWLDSRPAQPNQ